ncbi:MAG: hypothetical protein LBE38_06405 [Deltaproteobacteria bacterium]|jgi:hypothetical protein|nr:hypothetical protein [Deltaproteobacteria bacterium]
MTETKRRAPTPKDGVNKTAPEPTPSKDQGPKNKREDFRKVETPYGTVHFKRNDMEGNAPPRRTPWGARRGPRAAGSTKGPKKYLHGKPPSSAKKKIFIPALSAAIDRELPNALERLVEMEKVLSESAEAILNHTDNLELILSQLLTAINTPDQEIIELQALVETFKHDANAKTLQIIEATSFHDLSVQRSQKVRSTIEATLELLKKVQDELYNREVPGTKNVDEYESDSKPWEQKRRRTTRDFRPTGYKPRVRKSWDSKDKTSKSPSDIKSRDARDKKSRDYKDKKSKEAPDNKPWASRDKKSKDTKGKTTPKSGKTKPEEGYFPPELQKGLADLKKSAASKSGKSKSTKKADKTAKEPKQQPELKGPSFDGMSQEDINKLFE